MPESLNIFTSVGGDARRDLEFESCLLKKAASGQASLFLYSWNRPVLVLGRMQGREGIRESICAEKGVPILRRQTGGTGVLQRADLNIGLALPVSHSWAITIQGYYDHFLQAVETAMAGLGVVLKRPDSPLRGRYRRSPICFEDQAVESLLFEGKKALGCAQARKREAALVHGTLLRGFEPDLHAEVFGVSQERVEAAVAPIPEVASLNKVMAALVSVFAKSSKTEPSFSEPAPSLRPGPKSGAPVAFSARRQSPRRIPAPRRDKAAR